MTYNVHRCIGCDGKLSPDRIAEVIRIHRPDVVALQELDVGCSRTQCADQPAILAAALNMAYQFHPAINAPEEHYGDAILSRHPLRLVRAGPLPSATHGIWPEQRGALWVAVEGDGYQVQVVNTHLGLGRRERVAQADTLLGPDWLGNADCRAPRLLCGDFNALPGAPAHRRLSEGLCSAVEGRGRTLNTFPSRWPFMRLDHIFHSPDLVVRDVQTPRTPLMRLASDHLPLIVDFELT
jgi:endonuclease/exonuclease/phosphatase family metal-dependent hydrolase